jgi:hypothetical protein
METLRVGGNGQHGERHSQYRNGAANAIQPGHRLAPAGDIDARNWLRAFRSLPNW